MCDYCHQEYLKGNLICEHCGAFLDYQKSLFKSDFKDYKPLFKEEKNKKKSKKILVKKADNQPHIILTVRL